VSTATAFALAAAMAVITVVAIVVSVMLARPGAKTEEPTGAMLEVLLLRDQVKDLRVENERLTEAGLAMEQADREKAEANAEIWALAEKLAGILGYSHFDQSIERLENMPGVDDHPSLYHMPVLDDEGRLIGVEPTNNLKHAYVGWLHFPRHTYEQYVLPQIEASRYEKAQKVRPGGTSIHDLRAAGMVAPEDTLGTGADG